MAHLHAFKLPARILIDDISLQPDLLPERLEPAFGNNINLIALFNCDILKIRMKSDRQVGRQCPWSRCPYDYKNIFPLQIREDIYLYLRLQSKFYEYGGRFFIRILDLCLCKGSDA